MTSRVCEIDIDGSRKKYLGDEKGKPFPDNGNVAQRTVHLLRYSDRHYVSNLPRMRATPRCAINIRPDGRSFELTRRPSAKSIPACPGPPPYFFLCRA